MLVSLTVGKIDAGVAVLLTEDKRLIEFPSILLPDGIASGSIVDVRVSRNHDAEVQATKSFDTLQSQILSTFGTDEPASPVLRCRNATQTSIVLEWDAISLAQATLRSLSLYRNGGKVGVIPRPMEMTSTKISGLSVDTEYTFALVLRSTAGTYSSEKLNVRTHKMTDLSGITITPGVMASQLRESLEVTVDKIGAKIIDQVRIDTTHFVCTEERGPGFEKAKEMNIPIVTPDWVKGCEREGRLVGVRGYYLNADPKHRQMGPSSLQRQMSESTEQSGAATPPARSSATLEPPTTNIIPPTPERARVAPGDEEESGDVEEQAPTAPMQPINLPVRQVAADVESDDDEPGPTLHREEDVEVSPISEPGGPEPTEEKVSVDSAQSPETDVRPVAEAVEGNVRTREGREFDEVDL